MFQTPTPGVRRTLRTANRVRRTPEDLRTPPFASNTTGLPYRIHNVPLWVGEPESVLRRRAAETLGVRPEALATVRVVRSVLDARKKGAPRYIHTVEVAFAEGHTPATLPPGVTETEPPPPPPARVRAPERRPIIVGTGPAGLFCALGLLEHGVPTVLLERGREVVQRRKDVARLMRDGSLDPESNMNFGEGGAGAYTDGKLSTRINHPLVRKVIETFARYGAPERILVDGKPHIGSDLLPFAVARLREELIAGGCEVRFESRVEDVLSADGRAAGVVLHGGERLDSDRVVLAPGTAPASSSSASQRTAG